MIMYYGIDINKPISKPEIFVAKKSKRIVTKVKEAYGIVFKLKLGGINELIFSIPLEVEQNHKLIRNPNLDKINVNRLIKFVNGDYTEWFMIHKIQSIMEENEEYKQISCYNLGYELEGRNIRRYSVKSYNAQSVLNDMLADTRWNIDYVNSEFNTMYRDFEVDSMSKIDFLLNNLSDTFSGIMYFDTILNKISFFKPDEIGNNKGLRIKYGKYLKTLDREDNGLEMVTRLKVFGKDNLSIERVNPTGQNYIDDFSYPMYPFQRDSNRNILYHSNELSDELCHALLDYKELVESKDGVFVGYLANKETKNSQLNTLIAELDSLLTQLKTINDTIDVEQKNGRDATTYIQQRDAKQVEIDNKNTEINTVKNEISVIDTNINNLRQTLDMNTFFSETLLDELTPYIIEAEWEDNNYVDDEDLYKDAKEKIKKISTPQILLNLDIVNFLEIVECQRDWERNSNKKSTEI